MSLSDPLSALCLYIRYDLGTNRNFQKLADYYAMPFSERYIIYFGNV